MLLEVAPDKLDLSLSVIQELKMDGVRILYSTMSSEKEPVIYTRHNNVITTSFPELHSLGIDKGTILDGELIYSDSYNQGKPDFEKVMSRINVKDDRKVAILSKETPCMAVFFDILYWKGESVMHLPLLERKRLLDLALGDQESACKIKWSIGNGQELFNLAKEHSLEGIVLKNPESRYYNKRHEAWQKKIAYLTSQVYILGLRKGKFGWLLGRKENGRIRPAGVMEFGVSPDERKAFYQISKQIITEEDKNFIYIEPVVQCKIKYRNITSKGHFRIPVFENFIFNN
ncbi:hypothetical protein EKG37_17985 [Robertmurraya yapensis]|uniref:ATP-dependent DNA ligase family profile domain-containing protein n=2 Tax=Bacillaceae TaxID=186817 RepID=A0A431VY91_9BACI|nr:MULTISPECIES: hypothetical protein [Bacillaceae]RTR28190.1 hypothetical protein EKG37_17985 [Bacillus yapensis]TKC15111.1 hypothetical protein FA727_19670 [Robertmurraya kyonggiensis]TKS94434.1 hypothetical protein FAR12_17995 [Bacillus yapensis]